jgi:hypothetical protein
MKPLSRSLAAVSILVVAGAASATPVEASRYDDTTYPDLEVTWFSGTTAGGSGAEHDDAFYPEQLELDGGAAPAFAAASAHDDTSYPEDSRLLVQVGTPAPEAAADARQAVAQAPRVGGSGR